MNSAVEIRRYVAGDLAMVAPRPEFAALAPSLDAGLLAGGTPPGQAWTAQWLGAPIGCGGVFEVWPGRWIGWSWIGAVPPRGRRRILTACLGAIAAAHRGGARRLEAHAAWDCGWARRFLERLGFQLEGRAAAFGPDGSDHAHYALIFAGGPDGR